MRKNQVFFGQSLKLWGNNESEFRSSNPNKAVISESDYIARFAIQNSNNFSTDWSARLDPRTFKIYESIIKSLSKGDYTSLKEIINENFEMKEALISSRGKLCKNCPYR